MEWELTQEDYNNHQVAREGMDEGYGIFTGYVAVVKGNNAAIVYASHCSCYGTWDSSTTDPVTWTGTLEQMLDMAVRKVDPDMPSREINGADYNGSYLLALYETLLKMYQPQSKEE